MLLKNWQRPNATTSLLGAAVILACGGIAVAAGGGSGNTIHACFSTQDGTLRFVGSGSKGASKKCHQGERKLSWSQAGPRGLTGRPGISAPSADLAVTVEAPASVAQADFWSARITVRNNGPSASWVGLNNTVPGFFVFATGHEPASDRGVCLPGVDPSHTFTCAIGILAPRQTATVTFSTQACGNLGPNYDVARVTGSSFDPNLANNAHTATIQFTPLVNGGCG